MASGFILSFIQAPIVIHGLGNNWYGVWVLASEITGYTWLFDLGVREGVIRYVSKHYSKKEFDIINQVVSTAVYLYLIISILTIIVTLALVTLTPYCFKIDITTVSSAQVVIFITGLNVSINWFFNPYVGILMGLQRYDVFQKIAISMRLVNFALVIMLMKAGFGIISLAIVHISVSMISNGLVYWQSRKLYPELKFIKWDRNIMQFKLLINYGKYVLMNNIGSKFVFATDAILIGIFLPVSAIAFYSIPSTLVSYLRELIGVTVGVFNPFVSDLDSKNEAAKIQSVIENGTKLSFLVGLPIGIVYLFMGEHFISLWVGKDFGEKSEYILSILTISTLLCLWQYVMNYALYGLSRHHLIAYLRVAEAGTYIVLSSIFINIWGIVGFVIGKAISHIVFMGVILPAVVCKNLEINLFRYFRRSVINPIFSALPFAICCYYVNKFYPASNLPVFFMLVAATIWLFFISFWYFVFSKIEREWYFKQICNHIPIYRLLSRFKKHSQTVEK